MERAQSRALESRLLGSEAGRGWRRERRAPRSAVRAGHSAPWRGPRRRAGCAASPPPPPPRSPAGLRIFRVSLLSTLSFLGIEAAWGAHEPHWDLVTRPPRWTGSLPENRYHIPSFVHLVPREKTRITSLSQYISGLSTVARHWHGQGRGPNTASSSVELWSSVETDGPQGKYKKGT